MGRVTAAFCVVSCPLGAQVDTACNAYVAYEALSLFFTTPLLLSRSSTLTRLKRTAFRVPKMQFICVVLVLWWFYEYVYKFLQLIDVEMYLHNVQTDVRKLAKSSVGTRHGKARMCWSAYNCTVKISFFLCAPCSCSSPPAPMHQSPTLSPATSSQRFSRIGWLSCSTRAATCGGCRATTLVPVPPWGISTRA
jgi:hypothetical protein